MHASIHRNDQFLILLGEGHLQRWAKVFGALVSRFLGLSQSNIICFVATDLIVLLSNSAIQILRKKLLTKR